MEQSITSSLSLSEAMDRKNNLLNEQNEYFVKYKILLYLNKKKRNLDSEKEIVDSTYDYTGIVIVEFTNNEFDSKFFLDYNGKVCNLIVNGSKKEINHVDNRIFINNKDLNRTNKVIIEFKSNYFNEGKGINFFLKDSFVYIYTCLEPFECNTLFPCFDQPDLKAVFQLFLITDKNWTVVSNTEISITKYLNMNVSVEMELLDKAFEEFITLYSNKDLKITIFEETDLIPTYAFGFCAGDYFRLDNPCIYPVPIKIYGTQKVKDYNEGINTSFKVTENGISFMEKYLSITYPYKKCDLVFVPDFPSIAMENVGMPIFSEDILKNFLENENGSKRLINLILHELSHMWFGNLVTPSWWDDLWLNESFASFFAYLIILDNNAFKCLNYEDDSVWNDLHFYKSKAYFSELSNKCHPMIRQINHAEQASESFDLITYNKGCGLLKQLYYLMGKDNFNEALKEFITVNKNKNTNSANLLEVLNKYSDRSSKFIELNYFLHSWLRFPGVNIIELKWDTNEEGILTKFDIHQSCTHTDLTYQSYLIDIMGVDDENNILYEDILVLNRDVTSIKSFIGKKAMKAYLLNFNDWSYILVKYDPKTIEYMEINNFKFEKEYQKNTYLTNIRLVSITKRNKLKK